MKQKFTLKFVLFIAPMLFLIGAGIYTLPRLDIAHGYAAKVMCSCIFMAGRSPGEVEKNVLYHQILPWVKNEIDSEQKSVTSSTLGLKAKTARYKEGAGCILVHGGQQINFVFSRNDGIFEEDTLSNSFQWVLGQTKESKKDKLEKTIQTYFDAPGGVPVKRTTAVIVIHKDTLVAEQYASPFTKETRQLGWSMTKSLMNTFVGLMVQNGKIDPANKNLFPSWSQDSRKEISLDHLLLMNSGLEWEEDYTKVCDVTKMLYDSEDISSIPLQKQSMAKPGEIWLYSSGMTNLISKYLRDRFANDVAYHSYMYRRLFKPLGMTSMVMETDASGHFIGSSYAMATPRDWAKFGLLYLHDGVWQGRRLLPDYWVNYTTTPVMGSDGKYGAHFWLNAGHSHFKNAPEDMYFADGYEGQRVFIIPSRKVVIVRMGTGDQSMDWNIFIKEILENLGP